VAHLWVRDAAERLIEAQLDGAGATLAVEPPFVHAGLLDLGSAQRPWAWILPVRLTSGDAWVLVTTADGLLVNGASVPAGIRVFDSRDEVRGPDGRIVFFADERLARIEPFPDVDRPVRCGRCTCEIEPAVAAVRCPACGAWYHECSDFPCWTSVPFCQACGHATGLDGDGRWTPEES